MPEATSATATPTPSAVTDPSKLEVLKEAIYEACRNHGDEDRLFSQYDLLELDIIPNGDPQLLLRVLQSLTNEKLLIAVSIQGGLAWRWRSREDAQK